MKSDGGPRHYRKDTLLAHLGRHPEGQHGAVNPPVYHASTILSSNMAEWEVNRDPKTRFDVVRYGLLGDSAGLHDIWQMHSATAMASLSLGVVAVFAAALTAIAVRSFGRSAVA